MWRVKVHRCQIMLFTDETVRRRPAYFLLLAHRDCLWKINQRFVVLLCFIVTVTYHINKVKLLDARSLFWLVSFPEGVPEKDGHFLIKAPFDWDHTIFSNTKGCNCAPPNTAVHFQDKYSFSSYFWGNGEATQSISCCSVHRQALKLQPFLFYFIQTSTLFRIAQILHTSESCFRHLVCENPCAISSVSRAERGRKRTNFQTEWSQCLYTTETAIKTP